MDQAELVIQDFKDQIARLSEERALYFALATQKQQENNALKQEVESLKQEVEKLNEKEGEDENED